MPKKYLIARLRPGKDDDLLKIADKIQGEDIRSAVRLYIQYLKHKQKQKAGV